MRYIRRRVRTIILLVSLLVTTLSFGATAAAADTPENVEVKQEIEATIPMEASPQLQAGSATTAAVVPPANGCIGHVGLKVTAYYTNGLLTSVQSIFDGHVLCTTTGPGQTMAHLSSQANLRVGNSVRNTAPLGECSYPSTNPCVYAFSTDIDNCIGIGCAGEYWAQNFYTMLLPPGWIWGTPPSYCDVIGEVELYCLIATDGNINVSPIH